MEYGLIEILLVIWMLLITVLNHQLTNKYPLGLSHKQSQINSLRAAFYFVISLVVCCLIYFSAWLANWSNRFAIPASNSPYFADQLADIISTVSLILGATTITLLFAQEKRNLFIYKKLFGLTDILPSSSLSVIINLPSAKQQAFAERLSWLVERVEKNDPFELSILFDKDELTILAKLFTTANLNELDCRLLPIYQEVKGLPNNPKPFSIIL